MIKKELKHLTRAELIDIIYELQKQSDAKNASADNTDSTFDVDNKKQNISEEASQEISQNIKQSRSVSADIPSIKQVAEERNRLKYKRRYRNTLKSTIGALIVVAAIAILVATLMLPVLRIYGTSMAPTLEDGQIVVSVKNGHFESGDIVAFYHGNKLLIKRFIAGPGDWVDIDEDGNVSVNGTILEEPYIAEKAYGETNIKLPYQVPDNRYFLMGDNRDVSIDSRNTAVGCVSDEQLVGKVVIRIWPLSQFGIVR